MTDANGENNETKNEETVRSVTLTFRSSPNGTTIQMDPVGHIGLFELWTAAQYFLNQGNTLYAQQQFAQMQQQEQQKSPLQIARAIPQDHKRRQ